jgi:hypothetical protein
MIIFKDIFSDIQSSFSSLWKFKERGNTLEIITPYATTSSKFISIFLSERNGEYIISDGGWIDEGIYDNTFDIEDGCYIKIVEHYINSFDIQQTKGLGEKTYFYKKTSIKFSVPSLVMDLSVFISNLISLTEIEFSEKEEKESITRFGKNANDYLKTFIENDKLDLGGCLGDNKTIKLSAIIKPTASKLILINYITGSNLSHFTNSISKANFIFELAEETKYKEHISRKISIVDNYSNGYQPDKLFGYLKHLSDNTKAEEVNWSEKERLKELISEY